MDLVVGDNCWLHKQQIFALLTHSYGGKLITATGIDPRVACLVYVAVLAPDTDKTDDSLQAKVPIAAIFFHIAVGDGRLWLINEGIKFTSGLRRKSKSLSVQPT
jgi:hypothetical protein